MIDKNFPYGYVPSSNFSTLHNFTSGRAAGVVMQRILDVAHALLDADAMVRA